MMGNIAVSVGGGCKMSKRADGRRRQYRFAVGYTDRGRLSGSGVSGKEKIYRMRQRNPSGRLTVDLVPNRVVRIDQCRVDLCGFASQRHNLNRKIRVLDREAVSASNRSQPLKLIG